MHFSISFQKGNSFSTFMSLKLSDYNAEMLDY